MFWMTLAVGVPVFSAVQGLIWGGLSMLTHGDLRQALRLAGMVGLISLGVLWAFGLLAIFYGWFENVPL
jgi:CHASE2 domain-containing sensor protein